MLAKQEAPRSLSSIVEAIQNLKTTAYENMQQIEKYYRENDAGYTFSRPMNVCAGEVGGFNRGSSDLQENSFLLAKGIYFYFYCVQNNLVQSVDKIIDDMEAYNFTSEQEPRKHPLPDKFYADYLCFKLTVMALKDDLYNLSFDQNASINSLKSIFSKHSRNLIKYNEFTPDRFLTAINKANNDLNLESIEVDIDYLMKISTCHTGSCLAADHNIDGLADYLRALKSSREVHLFFEIFDEIYFNETALKEGLAQAHSTESIDEKPRWEIDQLRNRRQNAHALKMGAVLQDIAKKSGDEQIEHEDSVSP